MRRVRIALTIIGALALVSAVIGALAGAAVLRGGFSTRHEPTRIEAALATTVRRAAIPKRYRDMANPIRPDDERLEGAMEHWADHCAICHANDGSGDTSIGKSLYPRAPDMRTVEFQRLSDGELYYAINAGIRMSGMPAWGKPGDDDDESWALVTFIRKLPALTPEQLERMRSMNPRSAHEVKEDKEEEDFLNESEPADNPHLRGSTQ